MERGVRHMRNTYLAGAAVEIGQQCREKVFSCEVTNTSRTIQSQCSIENVEFRTVTVRVRAQLQDDIVLVNILTTTSEDSWSKIDIMTEQVSRSNASFVLTVKIEIAPKQESLTKLNAHAAMRSTSGRSVAPPSANKWTYSWKKRESLIMPPKHRRELHDGSEDR